MDGVAIVTGEVRELIRRRGVDPTRDAAVVRRLVEEVVGEYDERSITAALPPLADLGAAVKVVLDQVAGFGPLQGLPRRSRRRGDMDQRARQGVRRPGRYPRPHDDDPLRRRGP